MNAQFYFVLFYSLLITLGFFLLYFLYRYFLKGMYNPAVQKKYVQVSEPVFDAVQNCVHMNVAVPENIHVLIEVLNHQEEQVYVLCDELLLPGKKSVNWSLENRNGEFYFRVKTDKQQITRKIVVP